MEHNTTWVLDHIAHAVFDLESAIATYETSLGLSVSVREAVPEHGVSVAFFDLPNASIELIAPLVVTPEAPRSNLQRFLDSKGEGLHHICYKVPSVAVELTQLAKQGVALVDVVPRPGSRGMQVAFLHPRSLHGALIELCSEQ